MRAVNLIPPEDRRGDRAPTRMGPLAYMVVGALALAVAGVTAVVLTKNQIADRETEVASLEAREAAATARADSLAAFAEFASLEQARSATVDTLARSRFDWERVLRELALVLPSDVQLMNVAGTVAPGLALDGSANALRDEIMGPALELSGCAADQETVAELAASLEDIDGVTRVGVNRSTSTSETATEGGGTSSQGACETNETVYQFEIIAAFDEVVVAAATPPSPEASAAPGTQANSGVAEAEAEGQKARDSSAKQTEKAGEGADLIAGVTR